MTLTPILVDAATRREHIHRKAVEGVQNVFPLQARDHNLEVENVHVKPREYSSREQKDAILHGRTLQEALRGDVLLRNEQGKVVERRKNVTLGQVPFFTQRHTFVVDGNEYSVANQRRVRPGVYTRVRGNEELEAAFNLGKGENFRVNMDPAKGHMYLQYGSTNIPLYPVLRRMGVTDKELSRRWGGGVVTKNREAFAKKEEQAVTKLYDRLVPSYQRTATTLESKAREIQSRYRDTVLDPSVTKRTLGHDFDHVNPQALVRASQKILDVHREGRDTDDRDSLAFQSLHSVDDFLKERIQLEGRSLARKVKLKAGGGAKPEIDKVLPASPFTRSLRSFVTSSSLAAIPAQINPIEIIDSAVRITSLGEGGIGSERAVPNEARRLHHTHFGVIDPSRTPESFRAGIDLRAALWTKRDDEGRMHTLMRNTRSGKLEDVPVRTLEESTVAFPGETKKTRGISALREGQLVSATRKEIDYELPHPSFMFSPATNTVPMPESMQGNRLLMGAKMATQALPLVDREVPHVQVASYNPGRTFEQELARLITPHAPVSGTIKKIDKDYIYLEPSQTKKADVDGWPAIAPVEHVVLCAEGEKTAASSLIKIPYDSNFPLASKTYLHNDVKVKAGDRVEANDLLAESNFTKDGRLALGRNMNVGFLAYYGLNTNDAVVVSETGAKKLTSEHMYKEMLPLDDDITLSKNKHRAQFGNRWTAAQYDNLDDRAVAKPGAVLQPGDPVVLAIRKTAPTAEMAMLGRLHRTLATPFREQSIVWDHRNPGTVVDVVVTSQRVVVTLKTREAADIGDKVAGRYGNKGVISKVLSDDQMPRTKDGNPLDMLLPPTGVISRVNPAQIVETAVAKVAVKTGKPLVVPSLSGRNNVAWAKKLLADNDLTDKEVLYNPVTGKDIKGPDGKGVMVGPQYTYKLFKSTETNYSARGIEDYDVNHQPAKGGATGAKALGRMEINALLAHNARNVLKEASTIKSSRNDEFWRAYQLGHPLPPIRTSFTSEKFANMLRGAGVKIDKSNEQVRLGPLTDADVSQLSSGEIKRATMIREKDFAPEKDGLFDPVVTGGTNGTRWSHVKLSEPVVNPTFEDPVRRMLGMTRAEFQKTIREEGGKGVQKRLRDINMSSYEKRLRDEVRTATGTKLDGAVKQLKTARALKREGLSPDKAYVLNKLPVVPPVVRPILPSRGRRDLLISDANYLYRDAMLANDMLSDAKKNLPEPEVGQARQHLYDATKAVFGLGEAVSPQLKGRGAKGFITTIAGQGSPKRGFFHGKVLYRPQDLSGRGTAVPDMNLNMDEIGLPEDMLWKTYGPHIMRKLVQQGYKAVDAKKMIEEEHPVARTAMLSETKKRPVFLNRAPTLHRFGLLGAYPVPVPGKTIRVNPFIEQGMNLDYDGDTLQVHVPVTEKAVSEVKSITLSNLLFGDKTKSDLLVFPQHEAIAGVHHASKVKGGKKHRFKDKRAALAAYRRGEIGLSDTVQIG
jgi:DNA-directed RNA polymerase beta subunit